MTTPSQPERPEPPEGILSWVDCNCPKWRSSDAECGSEAKHPEGYVQVCTLPYGHEGDHIACYGRQHLTWPKRATRTPAPVAGEQCFNCKGSGKVGPVDRPDKLEECWRCGGTGFIGTTATAPTPPADKDAEIARLRHALGIRNSQFNQLQRILQLASDDNIPVSVLSGVLTLKSDLTTARATIAKLERQRDEAQTDARHWHQKLVVTMNAINGREDEILELCESDPEFKVAAEVISVQDARNLRATIAERDATILAANQHIEALEGALRSTAHSENCPWQENAAICENCRELQHDQIDRICLTCGMATLIPTESPACTCHKSALAHAAEVGKGQKA